MDTLGRVRIVAIVLASGVFLWPGVVDAGSLGTSIGKGASRGLTRKAAPATPRELFRRDRLRDRATPAKPLLRDRSATRYTSKERALEESRRGIPRGLHMAPAHRGRPLGGAQAKKEYGLKKAPEAREVIRLPKGFPIRSNKAVNGRPGVGEWTSPKRVPPGAIKKVVPIKPGDLQSRGR